MGVAGVAAMFAFYYCFKSIVSLVQFFAWKRFELVEGRLGPCVRSEEVKKTKINVHSLVLSTSAGSVTTECRLESKPNGNPDLTEGDILEGYYHPDKKEFRSKQELTKNLWMNPLMCLLSIAIVIGCFFLADALR